MVRVQKSRFGARFYIAVAAVMISIAVCVIYIFSGGIAWNAGGENAATQNIRDVYKLLTDRDVEILSVNEESGIYKVSIKTVDANGTSNVQDVFITKDGKLVTDRFLRIEDYRASLLSNKNFIDCLSAKGMLVLGQNFDNYTIMQMQVLGDFGYRIYFDCVGGNLQTCQNLGIKKVPSMLYNQTIYEGLKPVQWFEDMTGCRVQK